MQLTLAEIVAAQLRGQVAAGAQLAVAVSGGGDSLALLHILHEAGWEPEVVTVDHGLRTEAVAEARMVATRARALGLHHTILRWEGWDGRGNLQDKARQARQTLISDWARARGIRAVALGHTLDDQAETLLMRLARGSGVDGLSGMRPAVDRLGLRWLRPLLQVRREELRDYLRARGIDWAEDSSNADSRFDRIKMREALAVLSPLGITAECLAETAGRLAEARVALEAQVDDAAAQVLADHGDLVIDRAALVRLPAEIRRRLLIRALQWVAPAPYPPRAESLAKAIEAIVEGRRHTVHGCLLGAGKKLRISREPAAVEGLRCDLNSLWDGRWQLNGPVRPGLHIAALGEGGLAQLPPNLRTLVPRASLLASPAVWEGDAVIAAPLAAHGVGWTAHVVSPCGTLGGWRLSH